MSRLLSSLSLALTLVLPIHGISQTVENDRDATFTFDVASIRPANDHSGRWAIATPPAPGRFSANGITLMSLIEYAYHAHHLRSSQIVNAPDWAYSARWDIIGKTDDSELAQEAKLHGPADDTAHIDERNCLRLQALLADRFHLRVHFTTKIANVLVLTVVNESKLKPSNNTNGMTTSGFGFLKETGVSMSTLATVLSNSLQELVVNNTGLNGSYDMELKWQPDTDPPSDDHGPSIYTAIKEQLGLQLKAEKRPTQMLEVDQAEKPTEN